jgi:hypothetical protein
VDEALTVEALAVLGVGRELASRGDVTEREWAGYRRWRGEVLASGELEATDVACSCC